MIKIVGRKIVMQKGETDSFRILLRDAKGNEVSLTDSDVITLRMKYVLESNCSLVKVATPTRVIMQDGSSQIYHLINFTSSDTKNLLAGTYQYDVILENRGKRYTVVPISILELQESLLLDTSDTSSTDTSEEDDSVSILEADGAIDYDSVMSYVPLVGSFSEIKFSGVDVVDDEIIRF